MLEVAGLSSGYGLIGILNGVSFEVGAGEIVAVLGCNGMGKTTLLRTLWVGCPQPPGTSVSAVRT